MSTGNKSSRNAALPPTGSEKSSASGLPLGSQQDKTQSDRAGQNTRGDEAAGSTAPPHEDHDTVSRYRERLMREMASRRGPSPTSTSGPQHPSPIQEERRISPSIASGPATATSTESAKTVRGTPGLPARTPSYPFPSMKTPGSIASSLHRPFTMLSPTGLQAETQSGIPEGPNQFDKNHPTHSTSPFSNVTFQPSDSAFPDGQDEPGFFPSPNLYDLSLMLSAEPGVDAWWQTVVEITTACFKAERVTLALPGDSTDVENVPWGQKATYNAQEKDDYSIGYLARGSSMVPSSTGAASDATPYHPDAPGVRTDLTRPGLPSRHSFTSYENKKARQTARADRAQPQPSRPRIPRSKSSYPVSSPGGEVPAEGSPNVLLNRQALAEHDAAEGQQPILEWEPPMGSQPEPVGRVLPVLQALDFEADPLIDHNGVQRVLDRSRAVALTRSYPYLDVHSGDKHDENTSTSRSRSPVRT